MIALNLFLKALENNLKQKRGIFIARIYCEPNETYPAYVTMFYEVHNVDGEIDTLISKANAGVKKEDTEAMIKTHENLTVETISNILRYYGI